MCLLVRNNQIRRCRPCVKHGRTRLCSARGNWAPPPVIIFRTASDITTGCLQSDEYLMNNFNVNYMVAVIREETFSWGAAKEVKTLVNAEFVLGVADKQMQLYYTSKVLQIWHEVSLEKVYDLTSEDLLIFTALKCGFKIIRRILVRSQQQLYYYCLFYGLCCCFPWLWFS